MPKAFTDCVKNGGKVVRKNLKGGKYINICYDKEGNSHAGEVKTKKKKSKAAREKQKVEDSKALAKKLRDLKEHFDTNYRN
jgi:hypothetical protein